VLARRQELLPQFDHRGVIQVCASRLDASTESAVILSNKSSTGVSDVESSDLRSPSWIWRSDGLHAAAQHWLITDVDAPTDSSYREIIDQQDVG
jgi:hypothetical protein